MALPTDLSRRQDGSTRIPIRLWVTVASKAASGVVPSAELLTTPRGRCAFSIALRPGLRPHSRPSPGCGAVPSVATMEIICFMDLERLVFWGLARQGIVMNGEVAGLADGISVSAAPRIRFGESGPKSTTTQNTKIKALTPSTPFFPHHGGAGHPSSSIEENKIFPSWLSKSQVFRRQQTVGKGIRNLSASWRSPRRTGTDIFAGRQRPLGQATSCINRKF